MSVISAGGLELRSLQVFTMQQFSDCFLSRSRRDCYKKWYSQIFPTAWVCVTVCTSAGQSWDAFWSVLRSWRTRLVPAATSAGAQRQNTQSRLSAQTGPAAHSVTLTFHSPKMERREARCTAMVSAAAYVEIRRHHRAPPSFPAFKIRAWANMHLYLEITRWSYQNYSCKANATGGSSVAVPVRESGSPFDQENSSRLRPKK